MAERLMGPDGTGRSRTRGHEASLHAGVAAGFPNPDGTAAAQSRDFMGQGARNIASGRFQGMPVGGSMSASSIVVAAAARSRLADEEARAWIRERKAGPSQA